MEPDGPGAYPLVVHQPHFVASQHGCVQRCDYLFGLDEPGELIEYLPVHGLRAG